uniref:Uncharacterized protein n=1 Tax=Solanum tuberosum TaxID=4113 RepID=M1DHF5_SOLTU
MKDFEISNRLAFKTFQFMAPSVDKPTSSASRVEEDEPEITAELRVRDVAIPRPTNVTSCIQKLEDGGRISQVNPEWNGRGMKPVIQKMVGMLEVDAVTALTAQIDAMQKMMNTHFNNLELGQLPAQVNAVQQPPSWCEICGGGDHSADVCGANLDSVNFVGNAQRGRGQQNYGNSYNPSWRNHPNFSWGGNQNQGQGQNQYRP